MRKSISYLIVAMFLLFACGNQAGVDSSATPVFVPVPTMVRFTRTPGIKPSGTPVQQEPTDQPSRTPQPTATIGPSTLAAEATFESLALKFPDLTFLSPDKYLSPYGHWAGLLTKNESDIVLNLIEIDGDRYWKTTYYELHGYHRDDTHAGYIGVDHWSRDNTHVYLIPFPFWDGPGLWFTTGGATLIRFNLIDGSWMDMNIGASWSFSGDERYLIYPEENDIYLRTLLYDSEYVIRIPEKFETIGRFVWSPDNEKFVFTATHGEWHLGETGFSSFVFDTTNLSLRLLFEDDPRMLYPVEWSEKDKIVFCQYNIGRFAPPDPGCFYFDLNTNEFTRIPERQY